MKRSLNGECTDSGLGDDIVLVDVQGKGLMKVMPDADMSIQKIAFLQHQ